MDTATRQAAAVPSAERRTHPRFCVDQAARLRLVEHGLTLPSRILDLSLEGCGVHVQGQLPAGLRAGIEMTFTINGIPFRIGGTIVRIGGGGELGIRFAHGCAHRQAQWAEIVAEVQTMARRRG